MTDVSMSTTLPATAEKVWALIGVWDALADWHPGIEKSNIEDGGKVRRLQLVGGGELVERLQYHDDAARTYTYDVTSGPLPVAGYRATITVHDEDSGAIVQWSSRFDPSGASNDEAIAVIEGIYRAGFDSLQKRFCG